MLLFNGTESFYNSTPNSWCDIAHGVDIFAVTMLSLIMLNIIFHSIGCYLLLKLYKNGKENVQQIYLINLSITHTLGNMFQLISRVLLMVKNGDTAYFCIIVILLTLFTFSYYMSMVYITVDKALDILLNIKYPLYWNEHRAKYLVYLTWLVGVLTSVFVFVLHYVGNITVENIADHMFLYVYPLFDFTFVVLAVLCYSFLFHKYKQSRFSPCCPQNNVKIFNCKFRAVTGRVLKIFRTSNFYISVLLILTFLIFMVIPNLVYLVYGVLGGNKSKTLDDTLLILFNISYLLDAWIYIFAQQPVRRMLFKKLRLSMRCYLI